MGRGYIVLPSVEGGEAKGAKASIIILFKCLKAACI
jgi:hypothetical protein